MITFDQDYSPIVFMFRFLQLHCNCSETPIWAKTEIEAILTNCMKNRKIIQRVGAYLELDVKGVVYRRNISNACIGIIPVCGRGKIMMKIQSFKVNFHDCRVS